MSFRFNPFTGNLDYSKAGGSAPVAQTAKVIAPFNTDALTLVGDLCVVSASNTVTRITSNSSSEMPKGIFGIVYSKDTATTCEVLILGSQDGYSGFTVAGALFVGTDGALTHSAPATGMVQQVGFAITTGEIFLFPRQPFRRSA
jgi:hypothetical protein